MRIRTLLASTALLLAVAPAAAQAVETEGIGLDVKHVANIAYPDNQFVGEKNMGTDLEFATIAIPQPARQVTRVVKARSCQARKGRKRICRTVKKKVTTAVPVPDQQRTFALAGSYGDGLQVIDVTERAAPKLVATWDCGISQGDVQVFQRKDLGGRWFATYTQDDGYDFSQTAQCAKDAKAAGIDAVKVNGSGTWITEITDPYHPRFVTFVPVEQGSHNMTVHPSGRYLYNSNSDLITSLTPAVEIFDITDLTRPRSVGEIALLTIPGLGTESHDIGFSADGSRAYVAALSHGEILDTTDPAHPARIGSIVDPALNVWHEAEPITIEDPILGKRDFVIAEDEFLGAIGTGQCPNGGVHVYDVTGPLEAAPVKVGYWNIDEVRTTSDDTLGTCTAHVFQLHREAKLMTIAYYNGGVRVVDLSGLVGVALGRNGVGMKEVGSFRFPDSNTWAVKAPSADRKGFYFYGNDHNRGFDAYRYEPAMAGRADAGTWLTPRQIASRVRRALTRTNGEIRVASALCLLRIG